VRQQLGDVMGVCRICGKPAGLFRTIHPECAAARNKIVTSIANEFEQYMWAETPSSPDDLGKRVRDIALAGDLAGMDYQHEVERGLANALSIAMADRILTNQELQRISNIMTAFKLEGSSLPPQSLDDFLKLLTLKDLSEGVLKSRLTISGDLPINLKHDECVMWIFENVTRMEPKTIRKYKGRSRGVSVRIVKGVTYRYGASEGEPVDETTLIQRGVGRLYITNQSV